MLVAICFLKKIKNKYQISALHSLLHCKVGWHIVGDDVLGGQIVDRHVEIHVEAVEKPRKRKIERQKRKKLSSTFTRYWSRLAKFKWGDRVVTMAPEIA